MNALVKWVIWMEVLCGCAVGRMERVIEENLAIQTGYNRHLRPTHQGPADEVEIGIEIFSIGPVSESEMTVTLDVFFRMQWKDPRLQETFDRLAKNSTAIPVFLGQEYSEAVWTPDVYFKDAVDLRRPGKDLVSDSMIFALFNNTAIFQSMRLWMKTRCKMSLTLFPMDVQRCKVCIESYKYPKSEMELKWMKGAVSLDIDTVEGYGTANFHITKELRRFTREKQYINGNIYITFCIEVMLKRKLSIYLVTMYLPSISLVVLSWVGFWIDKRAVPARASLTITTILAQITLITGTANQFPGISDLKVADLYLIMNFFYVFASLIEFALVSYEPPVKRIAKSWLENTRLKLKTKSDEPKNDILMSKLLTNLKPKVGKSEMSPNRNLANRKGSTSLLDSHHNLHHRKSVQDHNSTREYQPLQKNDESKPNDSLHSQKLSSDRTTVIPIPDTAKSELDEFLPDLQAISQKSQSKSPRVKSRLWLTVKQRVSIFFSRETFSKDNADEISKWLFPLTFFLWNFFYFAITMSLRSNN